MFPAQKINKAVVFIYSLENGKYTIYFDLRNISNSSYCVYLSFLFRPVCIRDDNFYCVTQHPLYFPCM